MKSGKALSTEPRNGDDNPDKLLCTKEAAALLGLAPSTLNSWRSTGHVRLPHVRLGRSVRYSRRGLLKFLEETSSY